MLSASSARAARFARPLSRRLQTASWTVPVAPGGTLKARLPTVCTLRVGAADPHAAGGWGAATVSLRVEPHPGGQPISEAEARRVADGFGMRVVGDYEPGKNFLLLETVRESGSQSFGRLVHYVREWIGGPFREYRPQYDSNVVVDVRLPGKFNLDLEVMDGVVDVLDTFEGNVKLTSEYANVNINRLKSMYIDIEAGEGDIQAVVLQGNVSIRTVEGNVDIAKVQGPSFKLNTRDGDVQARAIYADYTSVRSNTGNVRLGGAQGNTNIRTMEGNVEVAGVEGRLQIETDTGDVEAQLSMPDAVSLRSRTGDIAIAVPPALAAKVMLQANELVDVRSGVSLDRTYSSGGAAGDERGSSLRGWIGETSAADRDGIEPRTIFARAPLGEVSLAPGQWAGFKIPSAGTEEPAPRFPRWAAAFPPPSDSSEEGRGKRAASVAS
jgi:Putative adhesin